MKLQPVLPLVGICLLCAAGASLLFILHGAGIQRKPVGAVRRARAPAASAGFASARAQLGGMSCASVGLHGGAAIGHYSLYVCAGPDHAGIGVPSGAFVCWGFHDFGLGRDQPAVELNVMDAGRRTIGGHVYPDTTVNCQRTLKVVAALL